MGQLVTDVLSGVSHPTPRNLKKSSALIYHFYKHFGKGKVAPVLNELSTAP
jgi:hypothetical protein